MSEYELTDEEIIDLVTQYHLSGVQNRHILAKAVAKAVQEKYRNYYLNMTDEELREEVDGLLSWYGEDCSIRGYDETKRLKALNQILSLVIPHVVEHYKKRMLERVDELFGQDKEVIKEV